MNDHIMLWRFLFYFPIPSSFVISLVKLNCMVLCHGNSVRVTGSFLRRSYHPKRTEELEAELANDDIQLKDTVKYI